MCGEFGMDFELIIFDMDGTLYSFQDSGQDDAIFKTRFYEEVRRRGMAFIEDALKVKNKEARKIWDDVYNSYDGNLSIGLEEVHGIDRTEYFDKVWNIDASKFIDKDSKLKDLIASITIKKAILTMAPKSWTRNVLYQLGIEDLFDGIWFGEGDIRKPDLEAYLQVVNYFCVSPKKTMIIEDEPKYLKPAKSLGMTTVLVGPTKEPYIDHNIEGIYDLGRLLEGHGCCNHT